MKEQIKGNWKQFKGKIKETWGRLTDDEIAYLDGKQDQFFGVVQEKYGVAKDEARAQLRKWEAEADKEEAA